ncbi:MAG: hypothetical protein HOC71_16720 [Candidatus Latescibacteria bacterium]|nr:hypothetical protein [Candidatus Latescibacterota bacterium]
MAVRSLAEQDVHILCSTAPSPWDIVTYLAGINSMNIRLIIMAGDGETGYREFERLMDEFALDKIRTSPLFMGEQCPRQPKNTWKFRDRFALENADVVYPVSIRTGGRLDTLVKENNIGAEIRNLFRIPWTVQKQKRRRDFTEHTVNPFPHGSWLVHWSRASKGPWPGEKAWKFYRDLIAHSDIYVRSAGETLVRILAEQKIRSSSWHLPADRFAVSFTSLEPENAVQLMRWRKRFVQYTFEPYGIGIKRSTLAGLGGAEVRYEKASGNNSAKNIFCQSPGKLGDWTKEKEWRFPGDCNLDEIDRNDMLIIVPDKSSAEKIQPRIDKDFNFHILFKD